MQYDMPPLPRNQSLCLHCEIPIVGPGVWNTCWLIQSQMLPGCIWPVDLEVSQYRELGVILLAHTGLTVNPREKTLVHAKHDVSQLPLHH